MSLHLSASLSPKNLSPEEIECWLARAEEIVQKHFSKENTAAVPSHDSARWASVNVAQAKPYRKPDGSGRD